jgi:hypothetical protein
MVILKLPESPQSKLSKRLIDLSPVPCYNNYMNTAYRIVHTERDSKMFKIGDQVRWQVRNKYRSNPRFQPSFLMYTGKIVEVNGVLKAEYKHSRTDGIVNTHIQEFRQLRNGKYIPKHESNDDPKGRLYMQLDTELEVAE